MRSCTSAEARPRHKFLIKVSYSRGTRCSSPLPSLRKAIYTRKLAHDLAYDVLVFLSVRFALA
jgi:hypothetical protein